MKLLLAILIFLFHINVFSQTWPFGSNASSITSTFGSRKWEGYDFHHGIDISAVNTTDVKANESGYIRHIGSEGQDDENIKIESDYGYYTVYMHIDVNSNLSLNQHVDEGAILGQVLDFGAEGNADDHLHLEYRETLFDRSTSYHPLHELPYTNSTNIVTIVDNEIKTDTYGSYIEIEISLLSLTEYIPSTVSTVVPI